MNNAYIVTSFLWAIAGLLCGYVLGRAGASIACEAQNEPVMQRGTVAKLDNALGIFIILLAVASVATMAYTVSVQRAQVACQTEFNERFTAALEERSEAAAQEREAQRQLLLDEPPRDDAIARYIDMLDAADLQRNANPLPRDPNCIK